MSLIINENKFDKCLETSLEYFPGMTLKSGQLECIKKLVLCHQDVLGVLLTGYRKSLIYQILPKLFYSIWKDVKKEEKDFKKVIIDLLELIRSQQVDKPVEYGIKAVTLDSSNKGTLANAEIIFGSAEQGLSEGNKQELKSGSLMDVSVLAVDEAHTVETC